ncbi:MAG: hypothetical protein LBH06_04140 [Rikenellaceae bacterium]|jgi:hypothetical protein|nr:hypothetical protein [Rikenellaceae bacterium]
MIARYKLVYNRHDRPVKSGHTAPVHLRVTVNRKVRYIDTGIRLEKH